MVPLQPVPLLATRVRVPASLSRCWIQRSRLMRKLSPTPVTTLGMYGVGVVCTPASGEGTASRWKCFWYSSGRLLCMLSAARNPLHALAGSARFIKEASRQGDEVYEDACIVLDNATSMSNLITAIADWTSATSDTSDAVFVPTDVMELCRKAVWSGVRVP